VTDPLRGWRTLHPAGAAAQQGEWAGRSPWLTITLRNLFVNSPPLAPYSCTVHDWAVRLWQPDGVSRQWFVDARDDGRRMDVSWHADEHLVIISLWHGSICRATFRMPVEDAPALLQALGNALGDALQMKTTHRHAGPRLTLQRNDEPLWYRVPASTTPPAHSAE